MSNLYFELLGLRTLISVVGIVGNIFLILSIIQNKFSRVKSFELFLLGLAASNLEDILIVDIYDILMLPNSIGFSNWSCRSLKFLTAFGETSSILFTVLISIFRYQKLRDASIRVNLPIFLDSIRSAWIVSGLCVTLAILLSAPIYFINLDGYMVNSTDHSSDCPPDFFQCHSDNCPVLNRSYKYLFLLICNVLPLLIITVNSCLIIMVLLNQRRKIISVQSVSGTGQSSKKRKGPRLHRSTLAVLTAMGLFQIDWTLYLVFHLAVSPTDIPFWSEIEFFISTSYTSSSPYVYGIGNNIFSLKNILRK